MNTFQLVNIMKLDELSNKFFKGVFASDDLNFILKKNESVIINLCPSHVTSMCHWIFVYNKNDEFLFYFDSSGIATCMIVKEIYEFLLKHKKKVYYNNLKIQHNDSILCGLFCVVILMLIYRNLSLQNIMKLFNTKNLKKNDIIILKIYKFLKNEKKLKQKRMIQK